jgi:hypothetical protein
MTGITRLPCRERENTFSIIRDPASRGKPGRAPLTSVTDLGMLLSLIKIILQYLYVQGFGSFGIRTECVVRPDYCMKATDCTEATRNACDDIVDSEFVLNSCNS